MYVGGMLRAWLPTPGTTPRVPFLRAGTVPWSPSELRNGELSDWQCWQPIYMQRLGVAYPADRST